MKLFAIMLMVAAVLVASCAPAVPANKICQADLDCVPAQCCHAADAVNAENAPDCSNTLCTLDCAPGTIDCGQGSVACVQGVCNVVLA